MLRNTKKVKGYELNGPDENFGRVKDFFFDDQTWTIRYLVADTGKWIPDRQVLLSPFAVVGIDGNEKHVRVNLTKEQVEKCPAVDADKPVSRQYEKQYHRYYGWPLYWHGPHLWGPETNARYAGPSPLTHPADQSTASEEGDPHLRSVGEVRNYRIHARDEDIGHVDDFIFDDKDWSIRYLVIDTVNWWPSKKVLIAPQWITDISWPQSKVFVELDRETIKQAPEYDYARPITRKYETRLYRYYGRDGYWTKPEHQLAHLHD